MSLTETLTERQREVLLALDRSTTPAGAATIRFEYDKQFPGQPVTDPRGIAQTLRRIAEQHGLVELTDQPGGFGPGWKFTKRGAAVLRRLK